MEGEEQEDPPNKVEALKEDERERGKKKKE